jgi:microcystin-dependent protein
MSMVTTDTYFPFTSGPGAGASFPRWRSMARNFVAGGSGVISGYAGQCAPSLAGTTVTISTGAVWVDGVYGEITTPKNLTISGSGMVVARMDPTAQQVVVAFVAGQSQPAQSPTGTYEIPLASIQGNSLTDIRLMLQPTTNLAIPSGLINAFAGSSPPAGWLMCDGGQYNRVAYAPLFTAIGTTYGAGDATGNNFNVPDLRGRCIVAATPSPPAGISARPLASTGGQETVALTSATNGQHNHGYWSGGDDRDHQHAPIYSSSLGTSEWPAGRASNSAEGLQNPPSGSRATFIGDFQTGARTTGHLHAIPTEGGQAHVNMQPFIALNYLIKT